MTTPTAPTYASRVRGCLLGGAIGDALGAPVEFMRLSEILAAVGDAGVRAFLPSSYCGAGGVRRGLITDDTQMTLFVAEGIIRGRVREDRGLGFTVGTTDAALRRWLLTQELSAPPSPPNGWLASQAWLYSQRAPGLTCLGSLRAAPRDRFGVAASNDSKGCGGVMRSAPFGLMLGMSGSTVYAFAAESCGYTHGHPTGQHAGGALALLVHAIVGGASLDDAVVVVQEHLVGLAGAEEVAAAVSAAVSRAAAAPGSRDEVSALGEGWVAEEALAVALYAALSHPGPSSEDVLDALSLAVTHSGDSDSTGSICGNILGALHGQEGLPAELVVEVEGRGTILELADDLVLEETAGARLHGDHGPETRWRDRYPG